MTHELKLIQELYTKYFRRKNFMNDAQFAKFMKIFPLKKTCYTVIDVLPAVDDR